MARCTVKTLTGRVLLRIPPETQNGRTFRLAGKGLPRFRREGRGDLLRKGACGACQLTLSAEARAAAEKVLDLAGPEPVPSEELNPR